MSSQRLPALDVTRGIAALAVVLFHYTCMNEAARTDMPTIMQFTTYGYFGVHLFFLISGFVIFMTLERTAGALDFFLARASRLYPAFLLSIVLTLACLYVLPGMMEFSVRDVLLNLTMFPDILGAKKVNPAYWTLSIEIVFYAIVFLAILLRGKSGILPVVFGWFALSALNTVVGLGIVEKLLILKWSPLFAGGAALYLATRSTHWKRAVYLALFVMTMPVAYHYAIEALVEQNAKFSFWKTDDAVVALVLAAIYALMAFIAFRPNAMGWLPPKFVELCGGGSYIIYLIHERAGSLMVTLLYPSLEAMAVVFVIAIMSSAAALIYVYFDKPAQKKLRALRGRAKSAPSASALNASN
jgi:peptidoglycan/LPS O-acetylase OafA/YrhL